VGPHKSGSGEVGKTRAYCTTACAVNVLCTFQMNVVSTRQNMPDALAIHGMLTYDDGVSQQRASSAE
jgi:hypothetical protein